MRYLRKYNDNVSEKIDCKYRTGYSEQELKDIFALNLEDNNEFDVSDIRVVIGPHLNGEEIGKIVAIVTLVEDFSSNPDYISLQGDISKIKLMIANKNKELLNMIGRKYDLVISTTISVRINQSDNRSGNIYNVEFIVNKIHTI
jgi:hypothetical protein